MGRFLVFRGEHGRAAGSLFLVRAAGSLFLVRGRWLAILYVDNTKPKIFTVAQVIHSARTRPRAYAPVAYASRKTRARGAGSCYLYWIDSRPASLARPHENDVGRLHSAIATVAQEETVGEPRVVGDPCETPARK